MYHLNNAQCHWLLIDRSGGFHANHEESPGASWGGNKKKYWQFTLARPRSLLESFFGVYNSVLRELCTGNALFLKVKERGDMEMHFFATRILTFLCLSWYYWFDINLMIFEPGCRHWGNVCLCWHWRRRLALFSRVWGDWLSFICEGKEMEDESHICIIWNFWYFQFKWFNKRSLLKDFFGWTPVIIKIILV